MPHLTSASQKPPDRPEERKRNVGEELQNCNGSSDI